MPSITICGFGNVGYHLALRFLRKGMKIDHIVCKGLLRQNLPPEFGPVQFVSDIQEIDQLSDIMILSVKDDQIESTATQIPSDTNTLVVHCAGATSIQCLRSFKNHGVFYPLQTFTKGVDVKEPNFPICILANSKKNQDTLHTLALQISDRVEIISDEQRKKLHLGAVIVNNFTNFLNAQSQQFCEDNQIDFDLLYPLMYETIHKLKHGKAYELQTGPAKRNDILTFKAHINELKQWPDLQHLYEFLSELIRTTYNYDS